MTIYPRSFSCAAYAIWALSVVSCSGKQPEEFGATEEIPNSSVGNEDVALTSSPPLSLASTGQIDSISEKPTAIDAPFYHKLFRDITNELEARNFKAVDALVYNIPDQTDLDRELHQHLYILSGSLQYRNCDGAKNELAAIEKALASTGQLWALDRIRRVVEKCKPKPPEVSPSPWGSTTSSRRTHATVVGHCQCQYLLGTSPPTSCDDSRCGPVY
jgi:hypothetical protein